MITTCALMEQGLHAQDTASGAQSPGTWNVTAYWVLCMPVSPALMKSINEKGVTAPGMAALAAPL